MTKEKSDQHAAEKKADRAPYESPAIIYEGLITTRATTGVRANGNSESKGANPADIFSSDS